MDISPTESLGIYQPSRLRRLSGFGEADYADAYLQMPESLTDVQEVLNAAEVAGRHVTLRGSGKSYGDAAYQAEEVVLSIARLSRILAWDPEAGVIEAEGGVTLRTLCDLALSSGWWPPVVGGIGAPTLAGCIAMNIHGKNHIRQGAFAENLLELDLLTAKGELLTLTPTHPDFTSVVGGLGLLGIVTRVKLQMVKVPSGRVTAQTWPLGGWGEHFNYFAQKEETSEAIVSWIDCTTDAGRGTFEAANYSNEPPSPVHQPKPNHHAWRVLRLITNPAGMRLANFARYSFARFRTAPRSETLPHFHHPLDALVDWQRAYRPDGLVQFQAVVPKSEAERVLPSLVNAARTAGFPPYLAVLKRHRVSNSTLNPYLDGYSLALDFPYTASRRTEIDHLYRQLADMILESNGAFYLAKDLLLTRAQFHISAGEENLRRFAEARNRLDPGRTFTSSLARRLDL